VLICFFSYINDVMALIYGNRCVVSQRLWIGLPSSRCNDTLPATHSLREVVTVAYFLFYPWQLTNAWSWHALVNYKTAQSFVNSVAASGSVSSASDCCLFQHQSFTLQFNISYMLLLRTPNKAR